MSRLNRTTRMLEYAVGAARQGRKLAIIAHDDAHRANLYAALRRCATKSGCAWVVGQADTGGPAGNIDVYAVTGNLVHEPAPGAFAIRGANDREVLVDHYTLEQKYHAVLDHYIRWL